MFRKAAKGSFGSFSAREALFAAFFAGGFLMATWITRTPAIREGLDALFGSAAIFGVRAPADQMPGAGAHLKLLDNETLEGGAVWLHYDVKND